MTVRHIFMASRIMRYTAQIEVETPDGNELAAREAANAKLQAIRGDSTQWAKKADSFTLVYLYPVAVPE